MPRLSFPLRKPECLLGLFDSDRIRPWRFKPEFACGFLSSAFGGCFNDRAQRIAQETCIFPVGVVNAPELIAWARRRGRAHGGSSPQAEFVKMYQLHKMRAQSVFRSGHVPIIAKT